MNLHALLRPLVVSAAAHAAVLSGILSAGVWATGAGRQTPVIFVRIESPENAGGAVASGIPGKPAVPETPGNHSRTARTLESPKPVPVKPEPAPQPVQDSARREPANEARPTEKTGQEETRREAASYQELETLDGGEENSEGYGAATLQENPDGNGNSGGGGTGNEGTGISRSAAIMDLPKPAYPRHSRTHGEEGTVVLEVDIAANGKPVNTKVVRSSGYRRLDDAALDALKKASFIPARILGVPTASTKRISIRFRISEQEEPR